MLEIINEVLHIKNKPFKGQLSAKVNSKNFVYIRIESVNVGIDLLQFKFNDLLNISTIKMPIYNDWLKSLHSITIFKIHQNFYIAYNYDIKILVLETNNLLNYYSQLFSFVEMFREENQIFSISGLRIKKNEELNFKNLNKGVSVVFEVSDFEIKMIDAVNKNLNLLKNWHLKIVEKSENRLNLSFKFPEDIKIYCEQYLHYFSRFLRDLGLNTTSNLKEEAGKVLFSITPTDDIVALDKIREALAIYLNLPSSPITDIEFSENFALMRLQQQVRNLQFSQQMAETEIRSTQYALRLAQQNIENQDVIIHRQSDFIEHQNKIFEKITSKSIMMDSVENKEEIEEIYEGVKVGESKWLKELTGLGLNPAKLIKTAFKNTFGKDEKKSILGLDEETEE